MDTTQVRAGSIVVGIDGSPWSDSALDWATDQASLEGRSLAIVHTVGTGAMSGLGLYARSAVDLATYVHAAHVEAKVLLESAVAHAQDRAPDLEVHDVLSFSDPRSVLLELGQHAAMIVVGSRGRGPIASLLLGSVSVSVAKHADCPVVVHRSETSTRADPSIAVGVDGTDASRAVIEFAFRVASFRASRLAVLHCYWSVVPTSSPSDGSPPPELEGDRALLSECLAGMSEQYPDVNVAVQLVSGLADQQLIIASGKHDLVVIGHHNRTPLQNVVYGSVAPAVLEHAQGAIAVVPTHQPTSELRDHTQRRLQRQS